MVGNFNRELLFKCLDNPANLSYEEEAELTAMAETYPWFPLPHSLLAKLYNNENSYAVKRQLKVAAVHQTNRSKLYELMHHFNRTETVAPPEEEAVDAKTELATNTRESNQTEHASSEAEKNTPNLTSTENEASNSEEVSTSSRKEDSAANTADITLETELDPIAPTSQDEASKIKDRFVLENEPEPVGSEESTGDDNQKRDPIDEVAFRVGSTKDTTEIEEANLKEESEEPSTSDANSWQNVITYDPIAALSDQTVKDEEEKELEIRPIITPVYNPEVALKAYIQDDETDAKNSNSKRPGEKSSIEDFTYWLDHFGEEDVEPMKRERKSQKKESNPPESSDQNDPVELLSKFIENRPRISRPKKEFFNPENVARKSVEDNSDIVSETLASLYVKQGHFEQAIKAYTQLQLHYPKKSAYFAAQIQDIKKKLN